MGNLIQFKRNLTYSGNYSEAVSKVEELELLPAEVMIVSYIDGEVRKYFVAIGTGDGNTYTPIYNSAEELTEYVQLVLENYLTTGNYISIDDIDTAESNVVFTRNSEGKIVVIASNNEGESVTLASYIYTTIESEQITQQELNETIYESITWGDL